MYRNNSELCIALLDLYCFSCLQSVLIILFLSTATTSSLNDVSYQPIDDKRHRSHEMFSGGRIQQRNPHPRFLKDETWAEIIKAANAVPMDWNVFTKTLDKGIAELEGYSIINGNHNNQHHTNYKNNNNHERKYSYISFKFAYHRVQLSSLSPKLSSSNNTVKMNLNIMPNAIVAISILPYNKTLKPHKT